MTKKSKMKKNFIFFIFTFLSLNIHGQCNNGIMSIFEDQNFGDLVEKIDPSGVKSGQKCLEEFSGDFATPEYYCNCITENKNTNYDMSRKKFRRELGLKVKSSIFSFVSNFDEYDRKYKDYNLNLNCSFTKTIKEYCSDDLITEMFNGNTLENLSSEIKSEYLEMYRGSKNDKNTANLYRVNTCQPFTKGIQGTDTTKKDKQTVENDINEKCRIFEGTIKSSCKPEALTFDQKDEFEMGALDDPIKADDYNYYCKIIDQGTNEFPYSRELETLVVAYKNREKQAPSFCLEICDDKSPYSFLGCEVNHKKAQVLLEKLNCKAKDQSLECANIFAVLGNDVAQSAKANQFNSADIDYLKSYLDEEDFNNVIAIGSSTQVVEDGLVDQFFATEKAAPISNGIANGEVAASASTSTPSAAPTGSQAPATAQPAQAPQVAAVNPTAVATTATGTPRVRAGQLRMGVGSGRSVSPETKKIVDTIKALRAQGSSLADALAQQDRLNERRERELAQKHRDRYQRYDARTLEPLEGERRDRQASSRYEPARVGSASSYRSGGSGETFGAANFGNTGSSTFEEPSAKPIVVDITGRSAPNLNLNNLESSGATLPASITNHPDASEISKLFNGLEYEKDNNRGPASKGDGEVKKIRVASNIESIDLGSLLITAKDIKPGDDFIIYQGDNMDKFVKLTPAYTYRGNKKVFVGYRIENRNSQNADLAASMFAKKFLIL